MHVREASRGYHIANPTLLSEEPLELVLMHLDREEGFAPSPSTWMTPPQLASVFAALWNESFSIGLNRDRDGFARFVPSIGELRNPNVAVVPTLAGYSELHELLASMCPDDVLTRYGMGRTTTNFALWPFSARCGEELDESARRTLLRNRAEACCAAFRDYAWSRLVQQGRKRGRVRDYKDESSLRVLFDDRAFWMNAAYRVALRRARSLLRVDPVRTTCFMGRERLVELYGHMKVDLPPLGLGEFLELKSSTERVLCRKRSAGRPGPDGAPGSLSPDTGYTELGLRAMPGLVGGTLWDAADSASRDAVFHELLGPEEMNSLAPVIGLLTREVLPEDLPDKRLSFVKADLERKLYRKPRKGQTRIRVEFRETVDDHAVLDDEMLIAEGEEVLRGVMLTLDARQRKVVVLLRLGRTRNEIVRQVGLKCPSGLSRLIARVAAKFHSALGVPMPRTGRA